jgi:branched-chain amino acid transport system ATP-binding protein
MSVYSDLATEARRTLDAVGLLHLAEHPVSDIAYGEKRRVELAIALAQKPRVLLLDEPLAGLSDAERSTVKSLIASITRETTVIMIEHDMDTALDLAETVTLLDYGRVIVDGERDAVIADERTREVYLGTSRSQPVEHPYLLWRQPHPARCCLFAFIGRGIGALGTQRRRKNHLHFDHYRIS